MSNFPVQIDAVLRDMSRRIESLVSPKSLRFMSEVQMSVAPGFANGAKRPSPNRSRAANYTNLTPANGIFRFVVSKKLQIFTALEPGAGRLSAGPDRNEQVIKNQVLNNVVISMDYERH
jgi:hypothetical protein